MSLTAATPSQDVQRRAAPSIAALVVLWLLAAVPMFALIGVPSVQRAQEARVLETARQMLGRGAHAWLIPRINGEIRLRKPPLAYWMAAAAFKLFGVSAGAGRIPNALCGWLTLGATFLIADSLFGRRAGFFAAAMLLGSYLFFRHSQLAETDTPAMLFVTLAVYAFWRAVEPEAGNRDAAREVSSKRHPFLWHHSGALFTGLAFFSKGGPGLFPLIFLIALALVRRRPKAILQFIISGAPLTLLVVAGWWFAYAAASRGLAQFKRELAEVSEGLDHPAWFYVYIPMLFLAIVPWCVVVPGAVVAAVERLRRNPRLIGLVIWGLSIFIPLCIPGNKQFHYLMPLMPCLMVMAGWLIAEATRPEAEPDLTRAVGVLVTITIAAALLAAVAIPVAAREMLGQVRMIDLAFAGGLALLLAVAASVHRRRGLSISVPVLSAIAAVALCAAVNWWAPSFNPNDVRHIAADVKSRFGDGPYVFLGGDTSMPLCFHLRHEIDRVNSSQELQWLAIKEPNVVAIVQVPEKPNMSPQLTPPPEFKLEQDVGEKGQHFLLYQRDVDVK